MRQHKGFTLLELLIAAAIMIIVLVALSSLFVSTTQAYRVNERVSEAHQNIEAAVQLLKYEIALAGYRGTDSRVANPALCPLPGLALAITTGSGANPDRITVQYCEDRYSSLAPQQVTFSIGTANGVSNLFRQQGANNQPAVEGVTNLKIVGYRHVNGTPLPAMPNLLSNLGGLTIRLTFTNGATRDVAIALPNPLVN